MQTSRPDAATKKRKPTAPPDEDVAPPTKRPLLGGLLNLLPWTPRLSASAVPPPATAPISSPDAGAGTQMSTVANQASPDAPVPLPHAARGGRARASKASGASVSSQVAPAANAAAPAALPPKARGAARASAPTAPAAAKGRGRKASVTTAPDDAEDVPGRVANRGRGKPQKVEASPEPASQAGGDVEAVLEEKAPRNGRAASVKRGRSASVGVSGGFPCP